MLAVLWPSVLGDWDSQGFCTCVQWCPVSFCWEKRSSRSLSRPYAPFTIWVPRKGDPACHKTWPVTESSQVLTGSIIWALSNLLPVVKGCPHLSQHSGSWQAIIWASTAYQDRMGPSNSHTSRSREGSGGSFQFSPVNGHRRCQSVPGLQQDWELGILFQGREAPVDFLPWQILHCLLLLISQDPLWPAPAYFVKLPCPPHSTHLRPLCAFDLNMVFLLELPPCYFSTHLYNCPSSFKTSQVSPPNGWGGPHLSCGIGIPALSFIECRVFIPKSTFQALSSSSITYCMTAPPSPGLESAFPAGVSVNPATSLMPGSEAGWGGQSINVCEINEWVMLPTGHSSVATSRSPWSVFKNKQHLQESTPSLCSLPEYSTPGLGVWFWSAFWTQMLVLYPRVDFSEEEEEGGK